MWMRSIEQIVVTKSFGRVDSRALIHNNLDMGTRDISDLDHYNDHWHLDDHLPRRLSDHPSSIRLPWPFRANRALELEAVTGTARLQHGASEVP